ARCEPARPLCRGGPAARRHAWPRHLLRRGADSCRRPGGRRLLQLRDGPRRHGPCRCGRPRRLCHPARQRGALHRAEAGGGRLPHLGGAAHDQLRAPGCLGRLAGRGRGAARRAAAGVPGGRAGRGSEPEDSGLLPGFRAAIPGPGRGLRRLAVRRARLRVGRAQHPRRHRGRLRGGAPPGRRGRASGPGPPPRGDLGRRHDRARHRACPGAASSRSL
ncbi:MAG: RhtB family transporter, partial [uncultured Craurococcus sp.]